SDADREIYLQRTPRKANDALERLVPGDGERGLEVQHRARYQWACRHVRGRSVLDVATGTGYGAAMLRRAGARTVYALDSSLAALQFSRRQYDVLALRADAHQLPIAALSI